MPRKYYPKRERAYAKKYYAANKEKVKKRVRESYNSDIEKSRKKNREWASEYRKKNKERVKAAWRRWYKKNKKRCFTKN